MIADDRDSGLLVAAFSLATDLGLGQPTEHVLRSWPIASRLADHLDVSADVRASPCYVTTLAWAGCVADTPEVASWFGDDSAFRRRVIPLDRHVVRPAARAAGHPGPGGFVGRTPDDAADLGS